MKREQIEALYEYHWTTTERLLESAGKLKPESYHAKLDYGHGSIHNLLFHILASDHGWRLALETGSQQSRLEPGAFPDFESIQSLLAEERDVWCDYITHLSDADLQDDVTLTTLRGHEHTFQRWHILVHLILHGMQHHSELSQLLTDQDLSPGNIDFIFYNQ
jgi:uncharacterized damage-inducible protein DinB